MKINNQTIFFSIPDAFNDNLLLEKGKTKMIQGVREQRGGLKKAMPSYKTIFENATS